MDGGAGPPTDLSGLFIMSGGGKLNSETARARLRNIPRIEKACDLCKRRKVRCSGGNPCQFCAKREATCTYSATPVARSDERNPLVPMEIVRETQEMKLDLSLLNGFLRRHYIETYQRHSPFFRPVLDVDVNGDPHSSPARQLQDSVVMMISAKALCHLDVAARLLANARRLAMLVLDAPEPQTVMSIYLLGFFQLGEDSEAVRFYLTIVDGLRSRLPAHLQTDDFNVVLERLRLSLRANESDLSTSLAYSIRSDWQNSGLPPNDKSVMAAKLLQHPLFLQFVNHIRHFPIQCEALDLFGSMGIMQRAAVAERTNEPLPGVTVTAMLELIDILEAKLPEIPSLRHRVQQAECVVWGFRLWLCTLGGIVRLGCVCVRRTLDALHHFSAVSAAFNFNLVVGFGCSVASFVILYRHHLKLGGLDWRVLLLELSDAVSKIAQFKAASDLLAVCKRAMSGSDGGPLILSPAPDDEAISATYLAKSAAAQGAANVVEPESTFGVDPLGDFLVRSFSPAALFAGATPGDVDMEDASGPAAAQWPFDTTLEMSDGVVPGVVASCSPPSPAESGSDLFSQLLREIENSQSDLFHK